MPKRRAMLALPFLALGCATDPVADYLGGFGSPIRGAILYAPRNLGDTSIYAGDPAGAAMAAAQLEFLGRELRQDPVYAPQLSPTLQPGLDAAVAAMRGAVGIAPTAPSPLVERSMRQVAQQLRAGDRASALATLEDRALYPQGAAATLERLSALPYLRRVSIAAGEVAAELDRLDRSRR
jgi:hypothetical protein